MTKLAVVGSRDSVLGFKALGMDVHYCEQPQEASHVVTRLAREGCAVIFVTEKLLREMPEVVRNYKAQTIPAIIPIPDNQGSTGLGMALLRANVEKAVGSDILIHDEKDV